MARNGADRLGGGVIGAQSVGQIEQVLRVPRLAQRFQLFAASA
jgi:hypothetical protein